MPLQIKELQKPHSSYRDLQLKRCLFQLQGTDLPCCVPEFGLTLVYYVPSLSPPIAWMLNNK